MSWLHFYLTEFFPTQTADFFTSTMPSMVFLVTVTQSSSLSFGSWQISILFLLHTIRYTSLFLLILTERSSLACHVSLRRWQGVLVNKLLGLFSIPLQCSFSEAENTHACAHMHTKLCQRWSTSKCHLNVIKRILAW